MRRPLRLPDFDYSSAGAYFVTIDTNDRAQILGQVGPTAAITLSDAGRMIDRWWCKVPDKFKSVDLDAHVVMPEHFHGIVLLGGGPETDHARTESLSQVIQWFKTMTTNEYFRCVRTQSWPAVRGKVWQRGFYDHVIRSEQDLLSIREYIEFNPGALFERYAGRTDGSAPTTTRTNP